MTKETETLKLAREALKRTGNIAGFAHEREQAVITAIDEVLAQPEQEMEQPEIFCGVDYADGVLAVSVMRRRPDDVAELLHMEQIELAQPEERNFCPRCGKRTADLTTIHTCTPPDDNALQRGLARTKEVLAGSQAFYGFPHGPVSTPN